MNSIPLEYMVTWGPGYRLIPKKIWLRKEHRFMTFREIPNSGAGRIQTSAEYEQDLLLSSINNFGEQHNLILKMR